MSSRTAKVVAVAMQKGGTGKSTTTINLARAASVYWSQRVLVVDFDPQGNTTSALAKDEIVPDDVTIADAVLPGTDVTIRDVIVPTIWAGVDLAPAGETLAAAEKRIIAADHGRELRLREALAPVLPDYDLILIDNQPSLGMLVINALAAADQVLVVAGADQWSADGLAMLHKTVAGVQRYNNPLLGWAGVVVNKWRNTGTNEELAAEIADSFPDAPVWIGERVPLWAPIEDFINAGKGLDEGPARLRTLAEDTYRPMVGRLIGRAA